MTFFKVFILALLFLCRSLSNNIILNILLSVLFIIVSGHLLGDLFVRNYLVIDFRSLLGVYLVLCILILGESTLLIFFRMTRMSIMIPYLAIISLIIIATLKCRSTGLIISGKVIHSRALTQGLMFKIFSFIKEGIISYLASILPVLMIISCILYFFRTDKAMLSVIQCAPIHFWLLIFLLTSYIFSYFLFNRKAFERREKTNTYILLYSASAYAFLIFGAYLLFSEYGVAADSYFWTCLIKTTVLHGYRQIDHKGILLLERGFEALIVSLIAPIDHLFLSENNIITCIRLLVDSVNPLLVSILLPFFIYMTLHLMNYNEHFKKSIGITSSLVSSLIFPTFFNFMLPAANWLGGIFTLGTLVLSLSWISSDKERKFFIFVLVSALTAFIIHPIPGTYAFIIIILALIANIIHSSKIKIKIKYKKISMNNTSDINKSLSLTIPINTLMLLLASILALVTLSTWLNAKSLLMLIGSRVPPALDKITLTKDPVRRLLSFLALPCINLQNANFILCNCLNWERLPIITLGILFLFKKTSGKPKKKYHLMISSAIFSFIAWVISFIFIEFPYRYFRLAFMCDLLLTPLTAMLLYSAILFILKKRQIITRFCLIISLSLITFLSIMIIFLIPLMTYNDLPPSPGRPSFRWITREDIEAIKLITKEETGYFVITSDEFLYKICIPFIKLNYFPYINSKISNKLNIACNSKIVYKIIINRDLQVVHNINSSKYPVIFILFNDWFIKTYNLDKSHILRINGIEELYIFKEEYYSVYVIRIKRA